MTSRILKEIHQTAKDMYASGTIDAETMREFDELCLPQEEQQTIMKDEND